MWLLLPLILVGAQLVGNSLYALFAGTETSRVYFLSLHVVPQAVLLWGLIKSKYWAWICFLLVTGYNTFDFAKSLLINASIFSRHFQVFMLATLCLNAAILLLLVIQKDYYDE